MTRPATKSPARRAGRPPTAWISSSPLTGSFPQHCLTAMRHPGVDIGSALLACFCLAVLKNFHHCLLGPCSLLPTEWNVPRSLLLALWGVLVVVLGGYCLFVCLALS